MMTVIVNLSSCIITIGKMVISWRIYHCKLIELMVNNYHLDMTNIAMENHHFS
jgi:hypothetical protein